ncbi:MAG: ATP-binding protein [Candidatus Omnitrophota bacterium]|jgi:PAS domain S-box-containing protein
MKKKNPKTKRTTKKKSGVKRSKQQKEKIQTLLKSLLDKEQMIKHTEDALLESIRRLRDIFEQSPIGIGLHDSKGELLVVNSAYLNIFGFNSFGEIKQQNLFKSTGFPRKETRRLRAGKVIQYETDYDFEGASRSAERAGTAHILFIVSPLLRGKKPIGYMSQVQDITERKKIAESQRLAQLGRLLSDMAHEINNPLMIISGNAELTLMEGVKDQKIKSVLQLILDECFLAEDIIQRLLKYSRLGKITKASVDIGKAIDLVTGILEHQFRMSNIEFKKDIKPGVPAAQANEKQFQEVLMNIIRNSSDAMPDGGVISLRVSRDRNYVKVEIEDSGEGMPQKVMERIFEPFFTTKQKGTGLGLAVCHSIIQEHGGDLLYDSKVGKGTTATILLPVAGKSKKRN